MRCSKCGADNRDSARFCDKCGTQFPPRCPSCGGLNRLEARFCDSCGANLVASREQPAAIASTTSASAQVGLDSGASEKLDGERKMVTALFADIKGSTELMAELDPEEARSIIDPALKLMIDAVHRYGGYSAPRRREKEALMGP